MGDGEEAATGRKQNKRECPLNDDEPQHDDADAPANNNITAEKSKKLRGESQNESREVLDVETALQRLFQSEKDSTERLADEMVVTIRVAHHAEDMAAIETFLSSYGKKAPELSAAIGNEDSPPSVFCILAESSLPLASTKDDEQTESKTKKVAALALFTLAWRDNQRILQLEYFHMDRSIVGEASVGILKRRMLLRLSALALMTGAALNVTNANDEAFTIS